MSKCPSDLALEAHLLDPARSQLTPHLDACPACQARIARMEAEGADFRQFVFPATVEAIEDAASPRRRKLFSWLVPLGGLVATAAVAMLVLRTPQTVRPAYAPDEPPPGYTGTKGSPPMSLAVFVGGANGGVAVSDGAAVPANAQLRFKVRPAQDCRLWIVSIDAAGQVSRIFPPSGEAAAVSEAGAVPGGAVLDGTAGPERFFAICAPQALPFEALERSARASAAGGADAIRKATELRGLPASATQASVLLEKKR
jgi:predicted anti-sigma-YlaC factor YlaD